jgi:ferrous iron transport protein A
MKDNKHIPLTDAPKGKQVKLVSIDGGHSITRRLVELGLTPGTIFKIVQDSGGPLIINVRNSKIALGRGMAVKLLVDLIDDEE